MEELRSKSPENTNASSLSSPIVFDKGEAIYVVNDYTMSLPSNIVEVPGIITETSETESLRKDKKITFNLVADDISCNKLRKEFGNNYIEGNVSPRKFMIKLDFNKHVPYNDIGDFFLLFEISDTRTEQNVVESSLSLSMPKSALIPDSVCEELDSELNRLQNDGPLAVGTVVNLLAEKIVCQAISLPKKAFPKRRAMEVPIEFIQEICKQEVKVCGLREAVQFALGSEEKIDEAYSVSSKSENGNEDEKLCCEICYIEEDVVECGKDRSDFTRLLHCSHQFCNECWSMYIVSCHKSGQTNITCPHFNCKTMVKDPLIWSITNSEVYQEHKKMNENNLISANPKIRHCPAVDCPQLAYVVGLEDMRSNLVPVLCDCGVLWCFSCQKNGHWPASCKETDAFQKEFKNHENYIKMLRLPGLVSSVQVKRCPFCCYPIDKRFGCNHMSCRCGQEFCWECLSPWENHDWELCFERQKEFEEVELTLNIGSARYNKYCKIALRNSLERNGKNYFVFKRLTERAKQVENAHELVTRNPNTSSCRTVKKYSENNIASFLENVFHFKSLAHFVLENASACVAVSKTTKLVSSISKDMEVLDFIVQRCDEVLCKPAVLFDEGKLEIVQEHLKHGKELVRNIHRLVKANGKL